MRKLKNLIPAARLRQRTPLSAKVKDETRSSSTYKMVSKYIEISVLIKKISILDITNLILTENKEEQFAGLREILIQLDKRQNHCRVRNVKLA